MIHFPRIPPPEGTVSERRAFAWIAVAVSETPEELRSPWGEDSDRIVAVLADDADDWRYL